MPGPLPLLLGHRGARATSGALENTLMSFDLALEHGCHGFEFDLRKTACGEAVVLHGSRFDGKPVSQVTCRQLQRVPRLQDVLRHYDSRCFLDIELKQKGLETMVLEALRTQHRRSNFVVSSFFPDVVMEIKARSAVVPVGIICKEPAQLSNWRKLPAEYIIAQHRLITRRLIQLAHGLGRKVFAWTVNDAKTMQLLAGWGVDGIISDDTQLLVKTLA